MSGANQEVAEDHPHVFEVMDICSQLLGWKKLNSIPNQPHLYQSQDTINRYFLNIQHALAKVGAKDEQDFKSYIGDAINILAYLCFGISETRKYDRSVVEKAWFDTADAMNSVLNSGLYRFFGNENVQARKSKVLANATAIYQGATGRVNQGLNEQAGNIGQSSSPLRTMFEPPAPAPQPPKPPVNSFNIASPTVAESPSGKGSLSSITDGSEDPISVVSEDQANCCRMF